MQRYLKRFLTVGIAVLALVAMLGLQAKVVWAAPEILLIQDGVPANYGVNPVPTAAATFPGKTWQIIQSTSLYAMSADDLNAYKIIILAERQISNYYTNLFNNQAKITEAVSNGSILLAHLSDQDLVSDGYTLPGGVRVLNGGNYQTDGIILSSPNNCVLNGLTTADFQTWNANLTANTHPITSTWSANGIFTNLTGSETVIMQTNNVIPGFSGPSYIAYSYGTNGGYVMATTMPIEAAYNDQVLAAAAALPAFLQNEISCAQSHIPGPADVSEALTDIQLRLIAIEAKLDNHDCPNCPICPTCPLPDVPEPLPWWRPGSEAEPPWTSILPLRNR
jgi:hypothetical protein